jgi:hypothetical protein
MMASNSDWVVPASIDARRWFVQDVSGERIGDQEYFGAIEFEMQNGGYAAMLYDLLHRDISGWRAQPVPDTAGLQAQKQLSLKTEEAWWLAVLLRGYVFESKMGLVYFRGWEDKVTTELLYASYTSYTASRHERHPLDRSLLGKFLVHVGCKSRRLAHRVVGERYNLTGAGTKEAAPIIEDRPYGYLIGALKDARDTFASTTGITVDWQDDAPDDTSDAPLPRKHPWRAST